MKLEQQVVSLELAKQLKELGVKQDSLFYWLPYGNSDRADLMYQGGDEQKSKDQTLGMGGCSAFTVAELFDYLYTEKGELWIYHNAGKYLVQGFHSEANEENLADCLAKILIANL